LKLVVGLGNPGEGYERTRHNVGFLVVEALARRHDGRFRHAFWRPFRHAACRVEATDVRLIEPTTFMNRSGRAVASAMGRWRVAPEDLVVVYDDVELRLGAVRVRAKGSGGSHNGMKSLAEWLGTRAFPRVRVGVGPRPGGIGLAEFVLGEFEERDVLEMERVVERAADAVESILLNGIDRTMNAFNRPNAENQGERN